MALASSRSTGDRISDRTSAIKVGIREVTNFRGPPATARQDTFASRNLHVIERFTRADADSILYRFTLEDPTTWTRPWSGEILIRRWEGPILEYACSEGNYGLGFILSTA